MPISSALPNTYINHSIKNVLGYKSWSLSWTVYWSGTWIAERKSIAIQARFYRFLVKLRAWIPIEGLGISLMSFLGVLMKNIRRL